MMNGNELATITVLVTCDEGSDYAAQTVPFKVYQDTEAYMAIPLIGSEQRKKLNLPAEIQFTLSNGETPANTEAEHLSEIIKDILEELALQGVIQ